MVSTTEHVSKLRGGRWLGKQDDTGQQIIGRRDDQRGTVLFKTDLRRKTPIGVIIFFIINNNFKRPRNNYVNGRVITISLQPTYKMDKSILVIINKYK